MSQAGNLPKQAHASEEEGKKGKKARSDRSKAGAKAKTAGTLAEPGPSEPRAEPRVEPLPGFVTHGPGVTMTTTSGALSTTAANLVTHTVTQAPQQQVMAAPFQVPYYVGPQQFQGYYQPPPMQPFPMFGNQAGFPPQEEEGGWEWEPSAPSASGSERLVHDISDDEEESQEAQEEPPQSPAREEELDFSEFKEGKLVGILKDNHKKAKQGDKLGAPINEALAKILNEFTQETKVVTEMERLVKDYPKVKNLDKVAVPKLENELFGAMDQHVRNGDVFLQGIQKAMVAAISALAPLLAFMLKRGPTDEQLEGFSQNIVDATKVLILANKAMTSKRRELLRPTMQATYAKGLGKGEVSPDWLCDNRPPSGWLRGAEPLGPFLGPLTSFPSV